MPKGMTVHPIQASRIQAAVTISFRRLLAFVVLTFLVGCDDTPKLDTSLCGGGAATVSVGIGDPYTEVPGGSYSIDEGLQGGYHVDISLSVVGTVDPDRVDIRMALWLDDTLIARHATDDWLLKIYDDPPHCEYPRARFVLSNRDGSLFELERVMTLVGQEARLDVTLETPDGNANGVFQIELGDINFR